MIPDIDDTDTDSDNDEIPMRCQLREARSELILDYLREPPGAKVRTFIAYYLREPPGERPTTKYEWRRQNSNFISYYLREPPGGAPPTTLVLKSLLVLGRFRRSHACPVPAVEKS